MTTTEHTDTVRIALHTLWSIKAPTKRAAFVAQTIGTLSTQAEVDEFTREYRRDLKVQDVTLLPETTWRLTSWTGSSATEADGTISTENLRTALAGAVEWQIDWPSLYSHWGVAVSFMARTGVSFMARSADWQLTETYLST